jgi:Holliday junction DNA helicase RuvA
VGASAEAVRDDTVAALLALGYPKAVAEKAVERAMSEEGDGSIEAVLKRALRRMSR